jgi:hypothetical protein
MGSWQKSKEEGGLWAGQGRKGRGSMSRPIGDLSSYRPSCRQDVTLIVLKDGVLLRPLAQPHEAAEPKGRLTAKPRRFEGASLAWLSGSRRLCWPQGASGRESCLTPSQTQPSPGTRTICRAE